MCPIPVEAGHVCLCRLQGPVVVGGADIDLFLELFLFPLNFLNFYIILTLNFFYFILHLSGIADSESAARRHIGAATSCPAPSAGASLP
jgi:hypothetical protein